MRWNGETDGAGQRRSTLKASAGSVTKPYPGSWSFLLWICQTERQQRAQYHLAAELAFAWPVTAQTQRFGGFLRCLMDIILGLIILRVGEKPGIDAKAKIAAVVLALELDRS